MIAESPREPHFSVENTLLNKKTSCRNVINQYEATLTSALANTRNIPQIYLATDKKKVFQPCSSRDSRCSPLLLWKIETGWSVNYHSSAFAGQKNMPMIIVGMNFIANYSLRRTYLNQIKFVSSTKN